MQITLEPKLKNEVRQVSLRMRLREPEVVNRALRYYLESVKTALDLQKEMDAWNNARVDALKILGL